MLLVGASEDRITPVDQHQRPIFEAAHGPAQLRIIEGGGHCGYLDRADLIGLVCGRSSLDAEAQRALGRAALTAWLRSEAMDDAVASEQAWQPDGADGTTVEIKGLEAT
jgi:pimeloyl-ACP methyl ester carboxylesterase